MTQAVRPTTAGSLFASDGKPHPLQDGLTVAALVLGLLSFVTCFFGGLHLVASWAGLIGMIAGAYGQWISITTRERFGLVVGMGASGIGFLIGMANGGLFGGLIGS
ncbi:hypothetical protein [Streptomyces sp. NPDC046860]|uniref:hypothetical protein n=1 Tax=Streptomyces sp. NPDC046860 TaxID=3154495 RepID=UPI0033EAC4FB